MATILSVMVLVAIALCLGAVFAWRRGARGQAALMLVLALVMAANVAIWTIPAGGGKSLFAAAPAVEAGR